MSKERGRVWPLASIGLLLANLSLAGMPFLAGFPVHQAIWEGLAANSLLLASLTLFGSLGLVVAALRTLSALIAAPEGTPWELREGPPERIILSSVGWLSSCSACSRNGPCRYGQTPRHFSASWTIVVFRQSNKKGGWETCAIRKAHLPPHRLLDLSADAVLRQCYNLKIRPHTGF